MAKARGNDVNDGASAVSQRPPSANAAWADSFLGPAFHVMPGRAAP